jgi:hypothetical protein
MDGISLMRKILFALLCAWPTSGLADVVIEHKEVGCVAAGKFPRFEARFDPGEAVAQARVHFRPAGWPHWYSVPMKREGAAFFGVLPKPEKRLQKLEYYISATDAGFQESRTPERTPMVVSGPGGCQQNKVLAIALKKAAQVIVNAPEGIANAPLVPVGFSTDGVIAGAAASTGTGAAATGGGISTAVLLVGGVAVAGGAAAVAAGAGDGKPCTPSGGIELSVSTPLQGNLDCTNWPSGQQVVTITNRTCSDARNLTLTPTEVTRCSIPVPPTTGSPQPLTESVVPAGESRTFRGPVSPPPCRGGRTAPDQCTKEVTLMLNTSIGSASASYSYSLDFFACAPCN